MSKIDKQVVLVKANWCGHCKYFFPIFAKAHKLNKDKNIKFISFDTKTGEKIIHDLSDDDVPMFSPTSENKNNTKFKNLSEGNFDEEYALLGTKIEGFPTVFVIMLENGKPVKKNMISHTVMESKEKNLDPAAKRFIQNISDGFKSLESDSKKLYVQSNIEPNLESESKHSQEGGNLSNKKSCEQTCSINNKNNINYESKYLKYKSKYLELKKKFI